MVMAYIVMAFKSSQSRYSYGICPTGAHGADIVMTYIVMAYRSSRSRYSYGLYSYGLQEFTGPMRAALAGERCPPLGHNYIGHIYTDHNYIGHICIGHIYIDLTYMGHNYIGPGNSAAL